jgi:glycosyltransferase involved in cell wall biosynthesis
VLTLHDAWLLAGHCAHSFNCERWKTGCGNCQDLSIYPGIRLDATAYNWRRKAEIYRKSRLHVVTPCRWLMDKVEQSMQKLGIVASKVIPNGVDLKVFHPADQAKTREELRLPHGAKILLFAANGIRTNIWKDYETLRSTLAKIAETRSKVLCIALGEAAPPGRIADVEIQFIPYQKDPNKPPGTTKSPTSTSTPLGLTPSRPPSSKPWPAAPRSWRVRSAVSPSRSRREGRDSWYR